MTIQQKSNHYWGDEYLIYKSKKDWTWRIYLRIIGLLLLGLAALLILLIVKYNRESSDEEKEIGEMSWLKNTEEPYDTKKYKELYFYPGAKKAEQLPACVQEFYKLKHEVTSAFFEKVVQPHLEYLQNGGTLNVVMRILMFLSTEGNIPYDRNTDSGYSCTLVQHSVDTARIGMEILKKECPLFYDFFADKYLVLFLGHDLGKTASSEGYTAYTPKDHPIFSGWILKSFIPKSVSWRNEVIKAVRNHHLSIDLRDHHSTTEKFDLWLLQTANREARESESRSSSADSALLNPFIPETTWDSGPSTIRGILLDEILEEILPLVNHIVSSSDPVFDSSAIPSDSPEGNFLAVSQPDGIVYVCPDVIYCAFLRVVDKKAVQRENAAVLAKPKNEALKDIVHWLAINDCIPFGHIRPGHYGRWYSFSFRPGSQRTYQSFFTPIIIQAFGVDVFVGDLEAKRREVAKIANLTIRKFNRQRKNGSFTNYSLL